MDARYKSRLHSFDNVIQTKILGGNIRERA